MTSKLPQGAQRDLREFAEAIWRAGVSAVDSTKLVKQVVHCRDRTLTVCDQHFAVDQLDRIIVVGAGKAGAGMAAGIEQALGNDLVDAKVTGWINVPADCVRPLRRTHLHAARPAGVNEPTAEGVLGSERILELVGSMTDQDLCLVLISGGGSALLPAPSEGISPADKRLVTRLLMHSGATIQELNTVRKRLSRIKGGGLLRAAPGGRMIALIISDVAGDPLDIIASGPTVCDSGTAQDALDVLDRLIGRDNPDKVIPPSVWTFLEQMSQNHVAHQTPAITCQNVIIGNNLTAVTAAAEQARAFGFDVRVIGYDREGIARDVGTELAELCMATRDQNRTESICFVAGGEPIVNLAPSQAPRRGGRNQEVALAAAVRLENENVERVIVLSGGTDGEDGPTDAAGAYFDVHIQQKMKSLNLRPQPYLKINDSYTFFSQLDGLIKTGPTHTNVMDLQVAIVSGQSP